MFQTQYPILIAYCLQLPTIPNGWVGWANEEHAGKYQVSSVRMPPAGALPSNVIDCMQL